MTGPVISFVTVSYNAVATIAATMDSVAAQRSADVEYVVVDGQSTDGTADLLKRRAGAIDRLVIEPDTGIYDAWNKALTLARGRYIGFIGADDVLLPGAAAAYLARIAAGPDVDFLSSRVRYGRRIIGQAYDHAKFRRYMNVAHVGALHSRALFDRIGPFDTSYRITGDYELLLRAGRSLTSGFVDAVTVEMGTQGISSGAVSAVFDEALRAKVTTGARGPLAARYDRLLARGKFAVRRALGW